MVVVVLHNEYLYIRLTTVNIAETKADSKGAHSTGTGRSEEKNRSLILTKGVYNEFESRYKSFPSHLPCFGMRRTTGSQINVTSRSESCAEQVFTLFFS